MFAAKDLEALSSPTDWVRGKAYFRNQRVVDLTVFETKSGDREIQAQVRSTERFQGRLTLQPPMDRLLSWSCSCAFSEGTLCRHLVAIGLQYQKQTAVPDSEVFPFVFDDRSMREIEKERIEPEVHILLNSQTSSEGVQVSPRLVYHDAQGRRIMSIDPLEQEIRDSGRTASDRRYLLRNRRTEQDVVEYFNRWTAPVAENDCPQALSDFNLAVLLKEVVPSLPPGWKLLYDAELERKISKPGSVTAQFTMTKDPVGLLSFDLSFQCGQLRVTPEQLDAYLRGQQEWLLLNGQYIEVTNRTQLQHLFYILDRFRPRGSDEDFTGDLYLASELADWAEAAGEADPESIQLDPRFKTLLAAFTHPAAMPEPTLPPILIDILRPYQRDGVRWLHFLKSYGMGGLLADDMGLGKTLQVLALLLTGDRKRPSLIVCPKTLLFNWMREVKKFAPDLKAVIVQGSRTDRQRLLRQAEDFDLLITSYPLYQRDMDSYLGLRFETCVLDEAQNIKNPSTHIARNVKRIRADQRLALTGTPMENRLLDLWSIFDFILPGFLGRKEDFQVRYTEETLGDLTRRIRPFLLRRTKAEVLPDLPSKIEQTCYAMLTQNQLALYHQTLQRLRKRLREVIDENALGPSRIEILAGLTRLRQICDHPGLIHPQYRSADGLSGKLELFEELLDECLDGGHKVLVFSQFTRMLSILRSRLDKRHIPYCSLEGQTVDRQSVVDQFNQSPGIPVFLISLKAGGYGLNLTSADTVVLFDPWWNPMVEDQAADRAHRFGQQKTVTVYRLITQGTIEEKMEFLQSKKRYRFDRVVNQTDDHHGALSLDDLRYLIEG